MTQFLKRADKVYITHEFIRIAQKVSMSDKIGDKRRWCRSRAVSVHSGRSLGIVSESTGRFFWRAHDRRRAGLIGDGGGARRGDVGLEALHDVLMGVR